MIITLTFEIDDETVLAFEQAGTVGAGDIGNYIAKVVEDELESVRLDADDED